MSPDRRPILVLDRDPRWRAAVETTYTALAADAPPLLLATYFDDAIRHTALLQSLPASEPDTRTGIVDERNIWHGDPDAALARLQPLRI
ncbi:MAG: 5-methyltetrahydropteroyltriglutamate--homocysteine methyltransferase [Bradyrhizobium sp.]|jgi:5-methyltetrahydropteroyltriglutamate--homocysteine methyltransferase